MALPSEQLLLERFMKLSIATAVLTIVLKVLAAMLTGSVGFLSDALESGQPRCCSSGLHRPSHCCEAG